MGPYATIKLIVWMSEQRADIGNVQDIYSKVIPKVVWNRSFMKYVIVDF